MRAPNPLVLAWLLAGLLSVVATSAMAATEPSAETRVRFADGCEGSGSWFAWDAVLDPDPRNAPGWSGAGMNAVQWGPGTQLEERVIANTLFENNRWAFVLVAADGETELFRAFYSTQVEPERLLVLDVMLDCSQVPFTVSGLPNSAMSYPVKDFSWAGFGLVALAVIFAIGQTIRLSRACG